MTFDGQLGISRLEGKCRKQLRRSGSPATVLARADSGSTIRGLTTLSGTRRAEPAVEAKPVIHFEADLSPWSSRLMRAAHFDKELVASSMCAFTPQHSRYRLQQYVDIGLERLIADVFDVECRTA
jgi:hypothetical protein